MPPFSPHSFAFADRACTSCLYIVGSAGLLRGVAAAGGPLSERELKSVRRSVQDNIDIITASLYRWNRSPDAALPDSDYLALMHKLNALIEHASFLQESVETAASGVTPDSGAIAKAAAILEDTANELHRDILISAG